MDEDSKEDNDLSFPFPDTHDCIGGIRRVYRQCIFRENDDHSH